jgi:predicted GH43/DUF377 family glycosyl hydrolase
MITRFSGNPILTPADVPYPVATVHNAAVVKHGSQYVMIFRSHRLNGRSILGKAVSEDGFKFNVSPEPFMIPATEGDFKIYEEYGVEDPRITLIGDTYYITYSAYSPHGVRIGLASTKDFQTINRISLPKQITGMLFCFPKK